MADAHEEPDVVGEEADVGPAPPPAGAGGDEEDAADVGPALPKAKKRKVGLVPS